MPSGNTDWSGLVTKLLPGGEAVVVPDAEDAVDVLVHVRGRRDGVVGVDDGDDVELEELVDGREELLAGVVVVKVRLGHEHLELQGSESEIITELKVLEPRSGKENKYGNFMVGVQLILAHIGLN